VKEGKVVRGDKARIIREKKIVGEGTIESLKHFKKDVKEILSGLECGIGIKGFTEMRKGDIIETYEKKQK